jgi:ribosomal protein S27AE
MDTNVATSQGQILMKAGDQIKTPTGQALTVRNIRRHETSRDHYYVDTDAGTTLVNWQTNFTLVPDNQSQQHLPGTGTPGGNFSEVPGMDPGVENTAPTVCPSCGSKSSLNRQGQSFKCTKCGYTDKNVGGGMNFSDATQMFAPTSSRDTRNAIAKRAQAVLDQEEENPS